MSVELRPISQADAFAFVRDHHRHHNVPVGALWWHAAHDDQGALVGVSVVGRPVARMLDDGLTVEVTRMCTLGTDNACSMLYAVDHISAHVQTCLDILLGQSTIGDCPHCFAKLQVPILAVVFVSASTLTTLCIYALK